LDLQGDSPGGDVGKSREMGYIGRVRAKPQRRKWHNSEMPNKWKT